MIFVGDDEDSVMYFDDVEMVVEIVWEICLEFNINKFFFDLFLQEFMLVGDCFFSVED